MKQDLSIPVLAFDGGAGTGKGTARHNVATILGFHELDSGVLYRALGIKAGQSIDDNPDRIAALARDLDVRVNGMTVMVDGIDQTALIRSDEAGRRASIVARMLPVRGALRAHQLAARIAPGLVADGRDMATMFDTPYKYFFVTDPAERARRRMVQFARMHIAADYDRILDEILRRDESDQQNPANKLAPHKDAIIIDTSHTRPEDVAERIVCDFKTRSRL